MSTTDLLALLQAVSTNPLAVLITLGVVLKVVINGQARRIKALQRQSAEILAKLDHMNERCINHAERIGRMEGALINE